MKKVIKRMIAIVTIGLGIIILIVFLCNLLINQYSKSRIYDYVSDIPYNKTGLLLGTSPTLRNGSRNPYFQNRIRAAAELYKAGKIKYVLVSGDNHHVAYNEPEEMRQALINAGVPADAIFLDYAGFRTLDSIVRANKIFGQEPFTIISQRFHNQRAVYIASWYGLNTVGYNAKDVSLSFGLKVQVRELFARVKVFIDFLFNKSPKFLGEKIDLP